MLYPHNSEPLTPDRFENPGSEYRATPFWAWNGKLDKDELLWQIEQFKKMGYGGFHMHVRTGMDTEYLSDTYMEIVRACVEKAGEENMLAWLYDEDRWPSGAAGGLVTCNHEYRQQFLVFSRTAPKDIPVLAVYDVVLEEDGCLRSCVPLKDGQAPEGFALYAYVQIAKDDPWFNNQAYLNTLDKKSVQAFIQKTHERYLETVGDAFGTLIPAIFTDEPQFSRKGTLSFALDEKDVTLPWTPGFAQAFEKTYGEDLIGRLPELLWDLPGGEISTVRYHYHDLIAEAFASSFADQIGKWCREHGLMLTGHMMEEPTLLSQTEALGEAMRSYRSFQLPGIDILCDHREYTTAKQAASAARQYGREGVLSELYGVTNYNFDFRGHKLQGDWQAALGVTVRVPHLSWYCMCGEAKRDYPATFNYQAPWYKEYKYIEDHFARVNTAMTRGRALCRVGVIHPVESYWLHWGAKENTQDIRQQMDERFKAMTEWLLCGLIDFDFISESLLPSQTQTDAITGDVFPVGTMRYETILVPPVQTLRHTTLERLQLFCDKGGRVVFLGDAPTLMDAQPSDAPKKLYGRCERYTFDKVSILNALDVLRDVEVRDATGARTDRLLYQMREEGEERWLYLCQAKEEPNVDLPTKQELRICLRGHWRLMRYDTLTGAITPEGARFEQGWTVIHTTFYDHDSLLLRMMPARGDQSIVTSMEKAGEACTGDVVARFVEKVEITRDEPNVLLLDRAEYALDDEAYCPAEEILRLDNAVRERLNWPPRGENIVQPWVVKDTSTPHVLHLRYTFTSEIELEGASLALENAPTSDVRLNGVSAGAVDGYYIDKCIGKRHLPAIRCGKNTLEVSIPFGKKTDVEAMYLLGEFGVRLEGADAVVTRPVCTLAFGDYTRQGLPFYGGNLTYHMKANLEKGRYTIAVTNWRGQLLRVRFDGKDAGVIAFAPYQLCLEAEQSGEHDIELTVFGSRINTLGQIHCVGLRNRKWWGPQSWRTVGDAWTYEYRVWPQGVLKSPEIYAR